MSKTIVISSPRSGLNLIRWIMETLTGQPTPGCARLIENKKNTKYLFHRTHNAKAKNKSSASCNKIFYDNRNRPLYSKCILLIRNPLELYGRYKITHKSIIIRLMNHYVNNLIAFEKFKSRKILIYYEDLIINTKKEIKKIIKFLNLKINIDKLDIDILKKQSLLSYNTKSKNKSYSDSKSKIYYSKKLLKKEKQYIIAYLQKRIPKELIKKYLSKYSLERAYEL